MRRSTSLFLTLLILIAMSACSSWKPGAEYALPVYSDDGQGIAAIHFTFMGKNTVTHIKKKDWKSQVVMKENTNAAVPAVLTPILEGRATDLFFMRTQGYLILGRQNNWNGSNQGGEMGEIWYDKIDMNGDITPIASGTFTVSLSCDGGQSSVSVDPPIRVIPSPDGQVLAFFESTTDCSSRSQTVTFLDPTNLSVIDGPFTVPSAEPGPGGFAGYFPPIDMAWGADGAFVTAFWGNGPDFDSYHATLYRPGAEPETDVVMAIDCFHPPTTSSEYGADSTIVQIDDATGAIEIEDPNDTGGMGPGPAPGPASASLSFGCNL